MIAVTDDGCGARGESASRNGALLLRAELGLPRLPDDERARRRRTLRLAATPTHCWKCDRELAPDDEVWRKRVNNGAGLCGGQQWAVVPWCSQCSIRARYSGWRAPCVTCGRTVVDTTMTHVRDCRGHVIACSDACRRGEHARRKAERRERHPRPCDVCGEHFTPTRADGRYCSSPCRQRAYRQRQREQEQERQREHDEAARILASYNEGLYS